MRKENDLNNQQGWGINRALLERSVNGKLKRTTTTEVASLFSVPRPKVQRIWREVKKNPQGVEVDVTSKKSKNCGRKRVQIDPSTISNIPLRKRTTMRTLSSALNVSLGVVQQQAKKGLLLRNSNAIKPQLKDENMIARLKFCTSMLERQSLPHAPKFIDMQNIVHIDEKWFYMTKQKETYYLHSEEEEPLRTCQSRNYIGKVMFLVAMARPRFDNEGRELFSEIIGMFPFVTQQSAQRRSKNREAGTLVTKPITSITREIIRVCLIEHVIPAIKDKWPQEDSRNIIYIQQDNARTHIAPNDEEFQRVASAEDFNIQIMCQPSNSHDLNVLDLGFLGPFSHYNIRNAQRLLMN